MDKPVKARGWKSAQLRSRKAQDVVTASPSGQKLRVLVASHGHPAITRGGAEMAAYTLYTGLKARADCETWFLGCRPSGGTDRLGSAITQPFDEREFVYSPGAFDWFKFANRDPNFPREFRALLRELRPDIVHFHHFIILGVEALSLVRDTLPESRIVLTLHEYLAICHHYGQMVTKPRQELCHRASLDDCNRCFPEIDPADFFLRALYIKRFFGLVDQYVAPSHFLAGRFVAWGLPPERVRVIENPIGRPATPLAPVGEQRGHVGPLRVGFFGQISPLKGILVLFEAAAALEREGCGDVVFDIHGEYRGQPPEFQDAFVAGLERTGNNVRYHGRYEPRRVDELMRGVDVTIIPSIWWENSPVVIQEAFRNRRPVICSDIGGMAEKVRDGLDGWHFRVGSVPALVALLKRLSANRSEVASVAETIQQPLAAVSVVAEHFEMFAHSRREATVAAQGH
jgi:glycosyltransferase involved in cell wall biosynthesis